jgi:DNA-directed RNA polymerase
MKQKTNTKHIITGCVIKQSINTVKDEIDNRLISLRPKNTGRHKVAQLFLDDCPLTDSELAYLTISKVCQSLGQTPPVSTVALSIADAIIDEMAMRSFVDSSEDNKNIYRKHKHRSKSNTGKYRRNRQRFFKQFSEYTAPVVGVKTRAAVGLFLIECMLDVVPIAKSETVYHHKRSSTKLVATKRYKKLSSALTNKIGEIDDSPLVSPPDEWIDKINTINDRVVPIVKKTSKEYLKDITIDEKVYTAINNLQNTKWCINNRVLSVAQELHAKGIDVAGLVGDAIDIPDFDKSWDEERKQERNRKASVVYARNIARKSKRLSQSMTIKTAKAYADQPEIYFACQIDWRGRVYYKSAYINPQRGDLCRGLLSFADSVAIDTHEQLKCLQQHGANVYGLDKLSLEDRYQWCIQNRQMFIDVADAPTGNLDLWKDADDPFQFLAFCIDYAGFIRQGYGYKSTLPVAIDGSCNALQIFSMLVGDVNTAKLVNVLPTDIPTDIYSSVALEVEKQIRADIAADPVSTDSVLLEEFIRVVGIDRKIAKPIVMSLGYGLTRFAAVDNICDLVEELHGTQKFSSLHDQRKACRIVANKIFSVANETIPSVKIVSDWLKSIVDAHTETGEHYSWVSPVGLECKQNYVKGKSMRICFYEQNVTRQLRFFDPGKEPDSRKSKTSVTANFIHCLDAAALSSCINNFTGAIGSIHDCVVTHSGTMPELNRQIRTAYQTIFAEDVLKNLQEKSKIPLPPSPNRDTMEFNLLESKYFFN